MAKKKKNQVSDLVLKQESSISNSHHNDFNTIAENNGLDKPNIVKLIAEMMNHNSVKIDKNGEVHENLDGRLRLSAIKLLADLSGWIKTSNEKTKKTAEAKGLTDKQLEKLFSSK